jgi:hypothetical protein
MALIWSRNKIWGGTFTTDVDVADGTNNASVVPASNFLGLVQGTETDPRNRSKWFSSVIGQLLRAVLHIDENRATGANIGVSGTGIESTEEVYVTPSQLPEVDKTTNDFSTPAKSDSNGVLTTTNDLFNVSVVTTDRKNKKFVVSLSSVGVLFFKARTWLESEIIALITSEVDTIITNNSLIGVRVGTITNTAHTTDDDTTRNIIIDTRTIGKGSSGATLNDDKYETLWKHLYDKYPDAVCTLNVTRTTRDADWIANRTLTLPKLYGKVIVGKDLTQTEFDVIGETGGEKTHTLTPAETAMKAHSHGYYVGSNGGDGNFPEAVTRGNNDDLAYAETTDSNPVDTNGTAHNNLQPYVVLNYQITY